MAKTSTPYEFLVRMNKDGTIAGAHIKFLDTYTDAGVIIQQVEGEAQPVSVAGSAGFPMDTILSAIQSAALATVEVEKADCATAKAETAKATEALTAAQAVIANKDAEIAALKAKAAAEASKAKSEAAIAAAAALALLTPVV